MGWDLSGEIERGGGGRGAENGGGVGEEGEEKQPGDGAQECVEEEVG